MATSNQKDDRRSNPRTRGRNNNPGGRNQYSGVIGTARANPFTTAAALGGAVAAGVFLWSRRDQIGSFVDEIRGAAESNESNGDLRSEDTIATREVSTTPHTQSAEPAKSQVEIAQEALSLKETGTAA
jgi:hypothetical protein